jgi:glutamate N-acetyltransferase/amino-acid N-acetyltransferase
MKGVEPIAGGIVAALGFHGGAVACGIKTPGSARLDLALVVSECAARAAGTFTRNRVKAAPVRLCMAHRKAATHRAVVLNSGNANACTGVQGAEAASAMAAAAAARLGCAHEAIFVCSTGRIGVQLPIARIRRGISRVQLDRTSGENCARAIMTSDTFPKQVAYRVRCGGGSFVVGGMAKGAGMIRPDMATMLCVITTDARVPKSALARALRAAVACTFNRITVDGDMSTNDTVLALANGAAAVTPTEPLLREVLTKVCGDLARMIVRDGEGVSRLVEVWVSGASTAADARRAAEAVANSTLVKCAWAGGDPNWGRIMDALGYSGARLVEERIEIDYGGLPIVRKGRLAGTPWKRLKAIAAASSFRVAIRLGMGRATHEVWTTDLTEEYVRLNLGE